MSDTNSTIRLNKLLANLGLGARRKISDFLKENKLEVNGLRVTEPGYRLNQSKDKLTLNGQELNISPQYVYFMLNKPKGVISTTSDEHGRKTVSSLINSNERLYPVGRLDQNTTGLIILTNDGDLAFKLTHPKFETEKTYQMLVAGQPTDSIIAKLSSGVWLKDFKTAPAKVSVIKNMGNRSLLEIAIHEGKNHEIRRMCSKVGLEILDLKRVSIGSLNLGNLPLGKYRELTAAELQNLKINPERN